jgi:hypothetical protein
MNYRICRDRGLKIGECIDIGEPGSQGNIRTGGIGDIKSLTNHQAIERLWAAGNNDWFTSTITTAAFDFCKTVVRTAFLYVVNPLSALLWIDPVISSTIGNNIRIDE